MGSVMSAIRTLVIPYSTWKTVVQNNNWPAFHKASGGDDAFLWSGQRDVIYYTEIKNDVDITDWQANFASASTAVVSEDDAIAQILGFTETALTPMRRDGVLLVQNEPAGKRHRIKVGGFKFNPVEALTEGVARSTQFDWLPTDKIEFQGMHYVDASGAGIHEDDYMELSAVFKAGGTRAQWEAMIPVPWPAGLPDPAPIDIVVEEIGNAVYLPGDGKFEGVIGEGTISFAPPIGFRFKYFRHSTAGSVRVVGLIRYWTLPDV